MSLLAEICLMLFIINLGTAFGAGLYETRMILPKWFVKVRQLRAFQSGWSGLVKSAVLYDVDHVAMKDFDSGRRFWAFVTTAPLTMLTLLSIALAWEALAPVHEWWLAASIVVLAERISTFVFFIPAIIKLQNPGHFTAVKRSYMIRSWLLFNNIRQGLTAISLILALKAMAAA